MKQVLFALVVVATAMLLQRNASFANKRPYKISALTAHDLRQTPKGAAVWFHKKGRRYLYVPTSGPAFVRFGGALRKLKRSFPTPDRWGCKPMTFEHSAIGGIGGKLARLDRRPDGWTLSIPFGTQLLRISGLACTSKP